MSRYVYIQLHNANQDPLYMELSSGKLSWTLPGESHFAHVRFLSHFAETGHQYYEDLESGEVSWALPGDRMTASMLSLAESIQKGDRSFTERTLGSKYDEELCVQQMLALDAYLAQKEGQVPEDLPDVPENSFLSGYQDDEEEEPNNINSNSNNNNNNQTTSNNNNSSNSYNNNGNKKDDSEEEEEEEDEDEEDRKSVASSVSSSSVISRYSVASMRTVAMVKKTVIKSGYLQKLATVSGRNWKRRFFTLNPYVLAYYVDESPNQKPKGEIPLTPHARITVEVVDKKYGYGFRYSSAPDNTAGESIVLAAQSEVDRAHWMQTLQGLVLAAESYLLDFVTLLPESTILPAVSLRSAFGLRAATAKVAVKKFLILTPDTLTVHADRTQLTVIEGVININPMTHIEKMDDATRCITLIDSDIKQSSCAMQFHTAHTYNTWKTALLKAIHGEDYNESNNFGTNSSTNSVKTNSLNSAANNAPTQSRASTSSTADSTSTETRTLTSTGSGSSLTSGSKMNALAKAAQRRSQRGSALDTDTTQQSTTRPNSAKTELQSALTARSTLNSLPVQQLSVFGLSAEDSESESEGCEEDYVVAPQHLTGYVSPRSLPTQNAQKTQNSNVGVFGVGALSDSESESEPVPSHTAVAQSTQPTLGVFGVSDELSDEDQSVSSHTTPTQPLSVRVAQPSQTAQTAQQATTQSRTGGVASRALLKLKAKKLHAARAQTTTNAQGQTNNNGNTNMTAPNPVVVGAVNNTVNPAANTVANPAMSAVNPLLAAKPTQTQASQNTDAVANPLRPSPPTHSTPPHAGTVDNGNSNNNNNALPPPPPPRPPSLLAPVSASGSPPPPQMDIHTQSVAMPPPPPRPPVAMMTPNPVSGGVSEKHTPTLAETQTKNDNVSPPPRPPMPTSVSNPVSASVPVFNPVVAKSERVANAPPQGADVSTQPARGNMQPPPLTTESPLTAQTRAQTQTNTQQALHTAEPPSSRTLSLTSVPRRRQSVAAPPAALNTATQPTGAITPALSPVTVPSLSSAAKRKSFSAMVEERETRRESVSVRDNERDNESFKESTQTSVPFSSSSQDRERDDGFVPTYTHAHNLSSDTFADTHTDKYTSDTFTQSSNTHTASSHAQKEKTVTLGEYLTSPLSAESPSQLTAVLTSDTSLFLRDTLRIANECEHKLALLIESQQKRRPLSTSERSRTTQTNDEAHLSLAAIERFLADSVSARNARLHNLSQTLTHPHAHTVAYEELLHEKAEIVRLLQLVRDTENAALHRLQDEEARALQCIASEAAQYRAHIDTTQHELRRLSEEREKEWRAREDMLTQARERLREREQRSEREMRERLREVTEIARQLSEQWASLQKEKKKVLTQRFALDLALRDMHTAAQQSPKLPPTLPHNHTHQTQMQNPPPHFSQYSHNPLSASIAQQQQAQQSVREREMPPQLSNSLSHSLSHSSFSQYAYPPPHSQSQIPHTQPPHSQQSMYSTAPGPGLAPGYAQYYPEGSPSHSARMRSQSPAHSLSARTQPPPQLQHRPPFTHMAPALSQSYYAPPPHTLSHSHSQQAFPQYARAQPQDAFTFTEDAPSTKAVPPRPSSQTNTRSRSPALSGRLDALTQRERDRERSSSRGHTSAAAPSSAQMQAVRGRSSSAQRSRVPTRSTSATRR